MTKETEKLIRYGIAVSPIFLGVLLLIFGDASDSDSLMVFGLSVSYSQMVVVVLFVLVIVFLVFYNKRAYDPNPAPRYKKDPRFVDQALIVSLWFFGALGVLVSGLKLHLEIYFQTITALAVMYVLLVAFRIDRLVRRTAEEEDLTLDLMGEALYWRTIYQRDVEAVIGRWQDLVKEGYGKKIEEILIKRKEKYQSSNIKYIPSFDMGEEFAKEFAKEFAELFKEIDKELAETLAKLPKKLVKELAEELARHPQGLPKKLVEEYAKKIPKELVGGLDGRLAGTLAEELPKKFVEEYAEKPAEKLVEGLAGILAEELAGILAEELAETRPKLAEELAGILPKLAEELAQKPPEEFAKKLVENRKKSLRRLINNKCSADLLAAKVMTEVIEKIDKDKSEEEMIDAYRFSIRSIDSIEEWEKEKAYHLSQGMKTVQELERKKANLQQALEIGKANLQQALEIGKANLQQALEIGKANLQQALEREKAKLQELGIEIEKADPQESDERILKLKEFQTDFTKFINSRQQGNNPSRLLIFTQLRTD